MVTVRRQKLIQSDFERLQLPELSPDEQVVENHLQELKREFSSLYSVDDMIQYWDVIQKVSETKLYQFCYSMPKGVLQHIHDLAAINWEDFLEIVAQFPEAQIDPNTCIMTYNSQPVEGHVPYSEFCKTTSHKEYADAHLRFSKEIEQQGLSNLWKKFQDIFTKIKSVGVCLPVASHIANRAFQVFYDENYQRIEIRTGPKTNACEERLEYYETFTAYKDWIDSFTAQHPDFSIGYISVGFRGMPVELIEKDANAVYENIKEGNFQEYVIGYDMVAEEDSNPPNSQYNEVFANLQAKVKEEGQPFKFYFHAGETVLRGKEGVYDACLFECPRIGHGLDLIKHPAAMEVLRELGTCVELNPISNRCLGYTKDLRTHPGWALMNHGIRCSISSDDPSIFLNYGGSYDWLWAIIMWDLDLAHIKKLVINSIEGTDKAEQTMNIWTEKWNQFVRKIVEDAQSA